MGKSLKGRKYGIREPPKLTDEERTVFPQKTGPLLRKIFQHQWDQKEKEKKKSE